MAPDFVCLPADLIRLGDLPTCRFCIRLSEPTTEPDAWIVEVGVVFADDPSVLVLKSSDQFSGLERTRYLSADETYWQGIRGAGDIWVPLQRVASNNGRTTVTTDEVMDLFRTDDKKWFSDNLLVFGPDVLVQVPNFFQKEAKVVLRYVDGEMKTEEGGYFSKDSLLSVRLEMAVDGEPLTAEELDQMARLKQPLVKMRGKWVYLNCFDEKLNDLKRIAARVRDVASRPISAHNDMVRNVISGRFASTSIPVEVSNASQHLHEFFDRIIRKDEIPVADLPRGLSQPLRWYQHIGYSWLCFLSDQGVGACLADDMGLGKTVQTLSWLLRAKEHRSNAPSLLICPTSVMRNWQDEVKKFAPSLRVYEHHSNRHGNEWDFSAEAQRHDVVITTYNILHRDVHLFDKIQWHAVILDEAQKIKNHETQQSRAARKLSAHATFRLVLTGTPVENSAADLWPIMEFLNPGLLGSRAEFELQFVNLNNNRDQTVRTELNRKIQPFVLRRLKSDPKIALELPEKMEFTVRCSPTREQREWYEAVLRELEEKVTSPNWSERRGAVLSVLTKLKQVCDHPALLCRDRSELGSRSGKLNRLVELLAEVLENGEKALIFTQYAAMAQLMEPFLRETFGVVTKVFFGELSIEERAELVKQFQADSDFRILILTIQAGGFGLNLTAATHVFHFDRWWNPAVEDQATDRVHRYGQTRDVSVHKFVCIGTLEERIAQMLDDKRTLSQDLLGESDDSLAGYLAKLNVEQLRSFFRLDEDVICDD